MCGLRPGDEVVCVSVDIRGLLSVGSTYTISEIRRVSDGIGVVTQEVDPFPDAFAPKRFRKVQKRKDSLTLESFLTIKPGFEEPRRVVPAPSKTRERT